MAEVEMLVDPAVSRAKLDRELAEYRKSENEYLSRGWWMLKAESPEVFVVFVAAKLKPRGIVFGAVLDFSNYDLWPPSVRLVDPLTRVPYKFRELPSRLNRRIPGVILPKLEAGGVVLVEAQSLMQAHHPDDVPFLCIPGVREYHQHPTHTGDPWLSHRGKGEGTLYFILNQLYKYGVEPVSGYQCGVQITGYSCNELPE